VLPSGDISFHIAFAVPSWLPLSVLALRRARIPLAGEPNGPLQATSVSVSLIKQSIVMVIAGVLAGITTRRGWRALRKPDAPAPPQSERVLTGG
jgi:hypothetical protein